MRIIEMPESGLHRAGRWWDVEQYPAPAVSISDDIATPLFDGPRWEDISGQFATVKLSTTAEGAVGRIFAKYQRSDIVEAAEGWATENPDLHGGVVNRMVAWFSGEDTPDYAGELELRDGVVPAAIFERLYEVHLPHDPSLRFIDISSPETLVEIDEMFGSVFSGLGLDPVMPDTNLARLRDRRQPRIVLSLLHSLYSLQGIAGIRVCGNPDPEWESYVVWSPPERVDLVAEDVRFRHVDSWDDDARAAADRLQLMLPAGDSG
jgi:hypothetical protein